MNCCDPVAPSSQHWSRRLPERTRIVARAAFAAVRGGERVGATEIAERTGLDSAAVTADLQRLMSIGEANLDDEQRVVAVAGLSVVPARHALVLDGEPLHTWCAYDAVGIPAALGADAVVRTACAWCTRPIDVRFRAGRLESAAPAVLWFPAPWALDANPQLSWCPQANLFCTQEHHVAWRAAQGNPDGEALTLAEAVTRGAAWWGPEFGQGHRLRGDIEAFQ
jgi:alkylmercury lyase